MKKKLLLILTLIAVVAMAVVGLAACDDEGKEVNLDGTYINEKAEAYSIVISGNKIAYIFDFGNEEVDSNEEGTFTIKDNTLTITGIESLKELKLNSDGNLEHHGSVVNTFTKQK